MDFVLNAKTRQAAREALDRTLKAPTPDENPTFKAGAEPGLGTWMESFVVKDTSWAEPKNPKDGIDAMVAQIVLEVLGPTDGGAPTNAGATHYHVAYLDMGAVKDPGNRLHGLNYRRIGVLGQLLESCGLGADEDASFDKLLNGDGSGLKPLVGMRVGGVVRKYKYSKKNAAPGEKELACEVDSFCPLP